MLLKVLFIAQDTSRILNKTYYYLERELAKKVDLMIWRRPGHISTILKRIDKRPDFILLLNDIDKEFYPIIKGLETIDIPAGLFVNDVHRFTNIRKSYIVKQQISFLFPVARDTFLKLYPEFQHKIIWFPHFVQSSIFKDYQLEKDIDLLMLGAVNKYYPLRKKIIDAYKGKPSFVHYAHPGYHPLTEKEEAQLIIGKRYARQLNRAKIFFTCPSIYNYPVLKYFEALAAKTLLLAPTFPELEDLGFIPGKHFIPINEHNFQERAAYYLKNERKREKISEQGYQFIHKNHTVNKRVQQLIKMIEKIIQR